MDTLMPPDQAQAEVGMYSVLFVCMGNRCRRITARFKLPVNARPAIFWLALVLTTAFVPAPVLAWGSQGHHVIARLASAQLSAKAQREVQRLLALEPGATLESISIWADNNRAPETARWHYVNLPRGDCRYDAARDCPQGQCVVAAIERQMAVLASDAMTSTDDERLLALKYLVHFVGDVHQPLHAGHEDDRGGNRFQLQAFMVGTNLHALWDTGMIRHRDESMAAMSQRLLSAPRPAPHDKTLIASAADAAEESCRIVGSPGFYPARQLDLEYVEKFMPVLEQRLVLAATRLAALLNRLVEPRLDGR